MDDRMEHCEGVKPHVVREHEALSGIPEDWPEVLGYNRTIPREDAVVAVEVEGDPLVAFGSYGKGRSAVFTTDCAPHWLRLSSASGNIMIKSGRELLTG